MYRVLECRKAAGLSQAELSRMAQVDQKTISNYENGGDMKVSAAIRIASALGVTLYELLGIEDGRAKETLFPDDSKMAGFWDRLNAMGRARLLDYARTLTMVSENTSAKSGGVRRAAVQM